VRRAVSNFSQWHRIQSDQLKVRLIDLPPGPQEHLLTRLVSLAATIAAIGLAAHFALKYF
jgi:hypothetical protein